MRELTPTYEGKATLKVLVAPLQETKAAWTGLGQEGSHGLIGFAPDGIVLLRMALGGRLDVGGTTDDGRIRVVIRGPDPYAVAGELAGLAEWLDVSGPASVRDHLAAIGATLVERYG